MGTIEAIFKGYTLGKVITGTKVVDYDGNGITPGTGFLRGMCRMVPFEMLSALGNNPWHDSLTHTFVIYRKRSVLPGK